MTSRRSISILFYTMGMLGIFLGVGIGIYSYFGFRPKFIALTEQSIQSLQAVDQVGEQVNAALSKNADIFAASQRTLHSGNQLIQIFPDLLTTLRGNLLEASQLLEAAGQTANQSTKGIAGLVTPTKALQKDDTDFLKTASQLKLLAGMVDEIRGSSAKLAVNSKDFSRSMSQLKGSLNSFSQLLRDSHVRLFQMERALQDVAFPLHFALVGIGLGGLYVFLGVFSLALGMASANVNRMTLEKVDMTGDMMNKKDQRLKFPAA